MSTSSRTSASRSLRRLALCLGMALGMVTTGATGPASATTGTSGTLTSGTTNPAHSTGLATPASGPPNICIKSEHGQFVAQFPSASVSVTDSGTGVSRPYTGPVVATLTNQSPDPFYVALVGSTIVGPYSDPGCTTAVTVTYAASILGNDGMGGSLNCTGTYTHGASPQVSPATCAVTNAGTTGTVGTSTDTTAKITYAYSNIPVAAGYSLCVAPAFVVVDCEQTGTITISG